MLITLSRRAAAASQFDVAPLGAVSHRLFHLIYARKYVLDKQSEIDMFSYQIHLRLKTIYFELKECKRRELMLKLDEYWVFLFELNCVYALS